MTTPAELDSRYVLDDLVQQFADPFAFFRELIQNAIDAGTLEVEIAFEWSPAGEADGPGQLVVHIEDFGEGMNREIIEGKLTRLFSSGKDNDFTKIGKFGIGFVSVFAIEPDAVCVDTGRAGETWRVLFGPDRSWQLIDLDRPIEGTQIRVFKTLPSRPEMEAFVARSRQVIRRWCRHVSVPIRIDGDDVREAFGLPGTLVTTHYEEEGTRIVAGVFERAVAPFGFYNGGLLLQEGGDSRFPHVGFKVDSRYLEHTLTRDQVVRDKHFQKAMALIERVIEKLLPDAIVENLVKLAPGGDARQWQDNALAWTRTSGGLPDDAEVFRLVGGGAVSRGELRKALRKKRALTAPGPDRLTEQLQREGYLVVETDERGAMYRLLTSEGLVVEHYSHRFVSVSEFDHDEIPTAELLVVELERLIRATGGRPTWVGLANLEPATADTSSIALVEDRQKVIERDGIEEVGFESLKRAREVVVDASHRLVQLALEVSASEPEFAAYQLLKAAMMDRGLDPVDDTTLATTAIDARRARLGGGRG